MIEKVDEKYYQAMGQASLAQTLTIRARDRIYADFLERCQPAPEDKILDVGVSDIVNDAANLLERSYPHPEKVTALGLGAGEEFRVAFPKVVYHQIADGKKLPFADCQFDLAVSNAVLEHVGDAESQKQFVAELFRVSKRLFITVPHRFFPVEHHTAIPLLHWTDATFGWACRATGKDEWARPENLILMSRANLLACAPAGAEIAIGYTGLRLGPFSSNLYLYARETRNARI